MWLGVSVLSEPSSTYKKCASNEGFGETSLLIYAISIKILHVLKCVIFLIPIFLWAFVYFSKNVIKVLI